MDLITKTDKERELVASELYHVASQTIYSMILGIKMVLPLEMDDKLRNHLLAIEKNSTESLNKIRELAFKLHPIMIKDLGFIPTLRTFIEKTNEEQNIDIHFKTSGDITRLSLDKEVLLYRLCSESITNFIPFHINQIKMIIIVNIEEISIQFQTYYKETINEKQVFESQRLTKTRVENNNGIFKIEVDSSNHSTLTITIPNDD